MGKSITLRGLAKAFTIGVSALALLLNAYAVFRIEAAADFGAYYWAGYEVRTGNIEHLYNIEAQTSDPKNWAGVPYAYSPFFGAFMAPWSILPTGVATHLWLALQVLLIIAASFLWHRHLFGGCCTSVWGATAFWLLAGPMYANQVWGQVNPLMVFLVVSAILLSRARSTHLVAGIVWGFSLHLKPLPGILLLSWWRKPRLMVGGILALAIPNLLWGVDPLINWLTFVIEHIDRHASWSLPWNASLLGALNTYAESAYGLYIVLGFLGLCVSWLITYSQPSDNIRIAVLLSAILWIASTVEVHHPLLALVPIGVLLNALREARRGVGQVVLTIAAMVFIFLNPYVTWDGAHVWVAFAGPFLLWLSTAKLAAPRMWRTSLR